jgi:hypothetical protein
MTFDGTTLTVNALTESSALKYKKDIVPISESLKNLYGMQGVYFTRKEDNTRQIGFIADEIFETYPELILLKDGEIDSLQYQRITAILVEAIKELNERLKKLEGN